MARKFPQLGIERFAALPRAECIPFGASAYFDAEDAPEGYRDEWTDEAGYRNEAFGTWKVRCSLKNYHGEVASFLKIVLPVLIARRCQALHLYEYDDEPTRVVVHPMLVVPGA